MRTINSLFASDHIGNSPFGRRRRRALAAVSIATKKKARATAKASASAGATRTAPVTTTVAPAVAPPKPTTTTKSTTTSPTPLSSTTSTTILNNTTVTATSCNERLHYVLSRKSREQLTALTDELRAHAGVKTVCVYTDSPLVSRVPLSQRQQRILLTSMSEACTSITTLQLDFSSEFGPQTEVILDCELLATILQNATQLECLLLKDVSLKGNVEVLEQVLMDHKHLSKVELKWCTEVPDEEADVDVDAPSESSIMSSLINTLSEMKHLEELTLLVSSAHNLPLPQLAKSKTLQRLTLGLEQRHVGSAHATTTAQSILQRHAEQVLLLEFLQALKRNERLQECTLFSHHWKSSMTLNNVCEILASPTSVLQQFSLTDYNYGSDDPKKLLELASVVQTNQHLQRFKLITKKRVSSTVDKKTRKANAASIDTAFVECLEQNYTLQNLEIVHAGITVSDTPKRSSTSMCKNCGATACVEQQALKSKQMIPFYLMTNRYQARQQFLCAETVDMRAWQKFVLTNKDNTPLVFFLLQANPSLLLPAMVDGPFYVSNKSNKSVAAKNGQLAGRDVWEYYF